MCRKLEISTRVLRILFAMQIMCFHARFFTVQVANTMHFCLFFRRQDCGSMHALSAFARACSLKCAIQCAKNVQGCVHAASSPQVRERAGSDWLDCAVVCSVSHVLRAFNARAHASIYIYIYTYHVYNALFLIGVSA